MGRPRENITVMVGPGVCGDCERGACRNAGDHRLRVRAAASVDTFSWLARRYQGQGLGREMREAMLHLVFEGLGAERAGSEAFEDNSPSIAVSRAVGYEQNGVQWALRQDRPAPMVRFLMTRQRWLERRRNDITVDGVEPCLPLLVGP
jgi:GNAT superfamily N-acetyltransferase